MLDMMRKETSICLILQYMFRIHHPSSVANTDLLSFFSIAIHLNVRYDA